ncbi:ankyrin 1 [Fusarium albosuccineum]|uniref:Ankyrin 1 n=1 Tax=Fusarium albosuccineum TaxID=1237068 RepID=A0A8H4LMQ4_9HYPO|nr:ankyrin 1 [Fusarium albosuccineum]
MSAISSKSIAPRQGRCLRGSAQGGFSSGNEELMLNTLKYTTSKSKDPRNIVWPPVLIYRAGWLGLDRFADEILALGCSPDPEAEWKSTTVSTPLSQASYNCHPKTVRVLVKHGADMSFQSRWDRNPLHLAAVGGHTEVVRVLVEGGKADISAKSDQDFTPTYLAAVFGNHKALELLLNLGGDPNMGLSPDNKDNGWSPLVVTAEDNFERCIQLLLDHGAHPDMASPTGTALKAAATRGHLKVCDMLLAAGADPKSKLMDRALLCDIIDMTPGHVKLQMLDKFLELGVDVNALGFSKQTALFDVAGFIPDEDSVPGQWFLATRRYPREVAARKLLDHGAGINIACTFGRTVLHEAISNNHSKALIEVLLDAGADTKQTDQWNTTLLCYARSNPEIVRLLLEKGADPNFGGPNSFAPLLNTAWWGITETVEVLLEYGAPIDLRGESEATKDWTALTCAAAQGHGDIVRILAEAGADLKVKADPGGIDVNQFSDYGYAPLHLNIPHDNLKRLINAGGNIEAEIVRSKDTPLSLSALNGNLENVKYLACLSGNFDIIKFLVEHDADVNQTCDNTPGSPLQALCVSNEALELPLLEEMLRFLLDTEERRPKDRRADVTVQGGTPGFAINTAAWNTTPRIIDLILEQKGATIDVKDDLDRTPIHFAALSGIPNFEAILNRGGDITAKDKMGRTALHWAAQPGRSQVVEKIISLLSDKTEIDAPDIDGWTPLCWAARGTPSWPHSVVQGRAGEPEEQIKVIKLLLENGANRTVVAATGGEKWTPLKIAPFSGCSDEVIQLLRHGIVPEGKTEEPEKDYEG